MPRYTFLFCFFLDRQAHDHKKSAPRFAVPTPEKQARFPLKNTAPEDESMEIICEPPEKKSNRTPRAGANSPSSPCKCR